MIKRILKKQPFSFIKIVQFGILFYPIYFTFGQNFVKNGTCDNSLISWNTSTSACPAANTVGWKTYTPGLMVGYPTLWEGTAFLTTKVVDAQSAQVILSQTISGLVPAAGNKVNLSLDVILGEANNVNGSNSAVAYYDDAITLEVWLGGTKYASVTTPNGWFSQLSSAFGKCIVSYEGGATSVHYALGGNLMHNVSASFVNGQAPYLYPAKNSNWDISIPWECGKTATALLEFKVNTNTYVGKSITDTRGLTYLQTCTPNNYSNLDDIAIDNVTITPISIPNTPALNTTTLYSSTCNQSAFNLTPVVTAVACPLVEPNTVEYKYYKDAALTLPINTPTNYTPTNNEESIWVVLANKPSDPLLLTLSSQKRELKIVKNALVTAGLIGSDFDMCSHATANQISNIISAIGPTGATLTYMWEYIANDPNGNYVPGVGINNGISYTPSLTTPFETITNFYIRRRAKSALNGLTCEGITQSVLVRVDPCAPKAINHIIENVLNPGGLINVNVPTNLFEGTTTVANRNMVSIKLVEFPKNATSFTISPPTLPNTANKNAKTLVATTYCNVPAASGCIGTPFPINGVQLPTSTNGNPINNLIQVDPIADGSFQIDLPYVVVDNFGFTSTNANASLVVTNSPLPITLKLFEVEKTTENVVTLKWQTENEINFSHFEIESSVDNYSFRNIAKVRSNENKIYKYQVSNLSNGSWYFRLKMIDLDGKKLFSPIKAIKLENLADNQVVVKGNPVNGFVKIDLNLTDGNYNLELFDMQGLKLITENKYISKPETDYQLNQNRLKTGYYLLRITDSKSGHVISKKIAAF